MRKMFSLIAVGVIVGSSFVSPAMAGRQDLDQARARLMRLHIRLEYEANNAPQVIEAQKQAGVAYTEMYKHREDVLTRLYQTADYKDLRLALYHTQRKLSGIREEIPFRIQKIMKSATDALAIRMQITAMEAAALDADADFVEVEDKKPNPFAVLQRLKDKP